MDNDDQRATIARHVREIRRHLLPILDWIENQLGPPAPEMGMAHAIETALGMEPSEDAEPLNDRHYWVLSQLAQDIKLTKHHVMAHYGFSERSAKRILSALTKRGLIEFCPDPRPGFYKLCNPELLQDVDLDLVFAPQDVEPERYGQRPPTTAEEPLPGGNAITVQSPTSVPST
jgi:hypothetical protein